jgi:hypothetical protein
MISDIWSTSKEMEDAPQLKLTLQGERTYYWSAFEDLWAGVHEKIWTLISVEDLESLHIMGAQQHSQN